MVDFLTLIKKVEAIETQAEHQQMLIRETLAVVQDMETVVEFQQKPMEHIV